MATESKLRIFTEFVGGISIVLSLIFVGIELRHANNVAEVESVQQINAMYVEMLTNAAHDEELIQLLADQFDNDVFGVRVGFRNYIMLNIAEASWKSFDRGIMDEAHYTGYMMDACQTIFPGGPSDTMATPDGEILWDDYKKVLHPDFTAGFEQLCKIPTTAPVSSDVN